MYIERTNFHMLPAQILYMYNALIIIVITCRDHQGESPPTIPTP